MGADAHVDVVALLVEGDAGVVVQVADVLDLILLAALLHKGDGLGAGLLVHGELEVLLDDLLHLGLDRGEVVLADLDALGQVDVVVEAVVGRGAVAKSAWGYKRLMACAMMCAAEWRMTCVTSSCGSSATEPSL